jgi:hypothetical protein
VARDGERLENAFGGDAGYCCELGGVGDARRVRDQLVVDTSLVECSDHERDARDFDGGLRRSPATPQRRAG